MMRSGSPLPRPASPAISEISVGSPSPPLAPALHNLSQHNGLTAFRPLSMKRARLSEDLHQQSNVLTIDNGLPLTIRLPPQAPQRRKSSVERVKSFSIADILGKRDAATPQPSASGTQSPPAPATTQLRSPEPEIAPLAFNNSSSIVETSILAVLPRPQPAPPATLLPTQILSERMGPTVPPAPAPLIVPPTQLLLDAHAFPKWQAIRGAAAAATVPMPLGPFLPPALLHYEQRLAWDYQRQLQEHFQAQAQLLRQMSMDPSIIPSEDGSERSHSSSTDSECCSPDLVGAPNTDGTSVDGQSNDKICNKETSGNSRKDGEATDGGKAEKSAIDTPLDALFQLSTKNFDDGTDPATLDIFSTRPNPKKKRKSRTAFTNHQIFELEKRFLYQKYLSPADRDEIAASLGLSNAQVITWFQNRRAKLKRDMEELKKDVQSVKQLSGHKSFLENVNDLSILKTRPVSRHQQSTISISMPAAFATTSTTFNGFAQQLPQFGASSSPSTSTSSSSTPHAPNIALIMPAIRITHTTTATTAAQLPTQQHQQQAQQRQLEAAAINVPIEIVGNNSQQRCNISSDDGVDNETANANTHTINQSRLHQLNSSRG